MANYSLVIDSKFSPFSYEELLKPALMATQAHQELEDTYSELATKANVWEEMANEQTDPYAYQMYKKYSNDLKNQADILASQGLTPTSRKALNLMKNRYSSEITPIEQAYARRQALIDEQRNLQAQDNTMMFDKNASLMSLDDLISNPKMSYQSYSGATLAKQVGTAAKALADQIRDNKKDWYNIIGGQYYEHLEQRGFKPEEVLQVIYNNPEASPILKGIVEDVIDSSNIANWADTNTLKRAYDYANMGLWEAVGKQSFDRLANKDYNNTDPSSTGGGKKPHTSNIDRTMYAFAKDRDLIVNKLLDENGKLKGNPFPLSTVSRVKKDDPLYQYIFDENGIIIDPTKKSLNDSTLTLKERNKLMDIQGYYSDIVRVMENAGIPKEKINTMNKEQVEETLKSISNSNFSDLSGTDLYRFSLDKNATEHIIKKVISRGSNFEKFEGKERGKPKYSKVDNFKIEDDILGDILFDPYLNEFMLFYNGEYYKMPKNMISSDTYDSLSGYLSPREEFGGVSYIQSLQDKVEKLSSKKDITLDEMIELRNTVNYLNEIDDYFGTVGNEFVNYVGNTKIN